VSDVRIDGLKNVFNRDRDEVML